MNGVEIYFQNITLICASILGALFSYHAINNNAIYFPRKTTRGYDLGILTTVLSGIVVYYVFIPHTIQSAVMHGIGFESFWKFTRGEPSFVRGERGNEYSREDVDDEKVISFSKELQYMSEVEEGESNG